MINEYDALKQIGFHPCLTHQSCAPALVFLLLVLWSTNQLDSYYLVSSQVLPPIFKQRHDEVMKKCYMFSP